MCPKSDVSGDEKGTKSGNGGAIGLESVLWMCELPEYGETPPGAGVTEGTRRAIGVTPRALRCMPVPD
jgi:hypothetical protein